jgi:hypothetical protein
LLRHAGYPEFWNTAYGVWVTEQVINEQKCKVVERYGSISGANALLAHYVQCNLTLVICSNTNATDLGKFKNAVEGLVIK